MKLLDALPWYVKYAIIALICIWKAPGYIQEKFDQRWEVKAAPYIRERDLQFKELEDDLKEIKQDTRDIRNHLMGAK